MKPWNHGAGIRDPRDVEHPTRFMSQDDLDFLMGRVASKVPKRFHRGLKARVHLEFVVETYGTDPGKSKETCRERFQNGGLIGAGPALPTDRAERAILIADLNIAGLTLRPWSALMTPPDGSPVLFFRDRRWVAVGPVERDAQSILDRETERGS